MVLAVLDQGCRGRPPGREANRDQGQHLRRRHPDDERIVRPRGLRTRCGRHGGYADPYRGWRDYRQSRVRAPVLLRGQPHERHGASAEPPTARPHGGRVLQRERCSRGRRRSGHGSRRRPGRIDTDTGRMVRHRGPQADLRPGSLYGRVPDRADPRSSRADRVLGSGRRIAPRRDRRRRRARSTSARRSGGAELRGTAARAVRRPADRRARRGFRLARGVGARRRPARPRSRGVPPVARCDGLAGLGAIPPRWRAPLERDCDRGTRPR